MSGFHVSRKLCFCPDKECTYFDNSFRCISVYLKVGACSVMLFAWMAQPLSV